MFWLMALAGPVLAHPHVWIDAKTVIVFNDDGSLKEIRHEWVFDEGFSAWTVQGLDTNGDGRVSSDEMQELAEENLTGLKDFAFYTFAGEGAADISLIAGPSPAMRYENGRAIMNFSVVPATPFHMARQLEVEVNDPEYYVAITFAEKGGATMENAPQGCSIDYHQPKELDPALADRLSQIGPDQLELPPDLKAAMRGVGNVATVTCPEGAAGTAPVVEQSAAQMLKSTPFAAPPVEPSLGMPRTGFFGWVNTQQKAFYGALSTALGRLKSDNNAFWVLGGLSFLYGVFHAAGPGHGKVIISSYMLAGERDVRRGIALSFAAALVQSLVAIAFVLVAAALLNMTAIAMSGMTNLMALGSYVLVALLGAWLVVRKLFGKPHSHDGQHHHGHGHDHHHAHDHDHHSHVVMPNQARGDWREMLGIVLAVGIRPCSGALVVLVFALSQGVLAAGIVAVLLMGIGTALTISLLAGMAVGAKTLALKFAGGVDSSAAAGFVWWLEMLAALAVFALGVILVIAALS